MHYLISGKNLVLFVRLFKTENILKNELTNFCLWLAVVLCLPGLFCICQQYFVLQLAVLLLWLNEQQDFGLGLC